MRSENGLAIFLIKKASGATDVFRQKWSSSIAHKVRPSLPTQKFSNSKNFSSAVFPRQKPQKSVESPFFEPQKMDKS